MQLNLKNLEPRNQTHNSLNDANWYLCVSVCPLLMAITLNVMHMTSVYGSSMGLHYTVVMCDHSGYGLPTAFIHAAIFSFIQITYAEK